MHILKGRRNLQFAIKRLCSKVKTLSYQIITEGLSAGLSGEPSSRAVAHDPASLGLFQALPAVLAGAGPAQRPLRLTEPPRSAARVAVASESAFGHVNAGTAVPTDLFRVLAGRDLALTGGAGVSRAAQAGVAVGGQGGGGEADPVVTAESRGAVGTAGQAAVVDVGPVII